MHLGEFQELALTTNVYSKAALHAHAARTQREMTYLLSLYYTTMKLSSEAGELGEHVAKAMRDDDGCITRERRAKMVAELGDVLWYVANIAKLLDMELDDVALQCLEKLADRAERGVIQGSGDDR